MVKRVALSLSLSLASLGVAACDAIVGIPDGRHLAGSDAASDAGEGAAESGGLEASMDAAAEGSPDAAREASADAGSEASADASHRWCAAVTPKPLFCDDFDEGGGLSAVWTKQSPMAGYVAIDAVHAESSPASLHVNIDPGGNTGAQVGYAATTFAATPSRIEVAFALWPDSLVPDDGANFVATLQVGQNTLTLYINPAKTAWQEHVEQVDGGFSFPPDHAIGGGLSVTSWTDVDAVIDFSQRPARLTVTYGGAQVLATSLDPAWIAAPWSLTLGPIFLNNTLDARSFHYDDVVVWTRP